MPAAALMGNRQGGRPGKAADPQQDRVPGDKCAEEQPSQQSGLRQFHKIEF